MKITSWPEGKHGRLSENAVAERFPESLHQVFRREIAEPATFSGVAGSRTLVALTGSFVLMADGRKETIHPGDVVDLAGGPFTFSCESPVVFMAVYKLPPEMWPN